MAALFFNQTKLNGWPCFCHPLSTALLREQVPQLPKPSPCAPPQAPGCWCLTWLQSRHPSFRGPPRHPQSRRDGDAPPWRALRSRNRMTACGGSCQDGLAGPHFTNEEGDAWGLAFTLPKACGSWWSSQDPVLLPQGCFFCPPPLEALCGWVSVAQ